MKNVIITGASKGIGAECAKKFAENGYNLILNYNKSEKCALQIRNEIKKNFPNLIVEVYKCDVKNLYECENMVKFAISILGNIDILVANAGIAQTKLFLDTNEEDFNEVIGTNLKGVINSIKAVLPNMISNQNGNIVAISSIWGISGGATEALYSASKAGVIGLCKALAKELGPSNIKINSVAPGAIETEMNKNLTNQEKQDFANQTALGRFGTAREIADSVFFLATSSYITGQTLVVDGGYLI